MTDPQPEKQPHTEIETQFSEYYEGSLAEAQRKEVEAHLAGCEACRLAYQEFQRTVAALSELHKMSAPQHFDKAVEDTIRRRSAGRFFGRKAFGDRIPFEILAIVVLLLGLAVFYVIRSSQTGSLRYDTDPEQPRIAPGAREVVPRLTPGQPSTKQ